MIVGRRPTAPSPRSGPCDNGDDNDIYKQQVCLRYHRCVASGLLRFLTLSQYCTHVCLVVTNWSRRVLALDFGEVKKILLLVGVTERVLKKKKRGCKFYISTSCTSQLREFGTKSLSESFTVSCCKVSVTSALHVGHSQISCALGVTVHKV